MTARVYNELSQFFLLVKINVLGEFELNEFELEDRNWLVIQAYVQPVMSNYFGIW